MRARGCEQGVPEKELLSANLPWLNKRKHFWSDGDRLIYYPPNSMEPVKTSLPPNREQPFVSLSEDVERLSCNCVKEIQYVQKDLFQSGKSFFSIVLLLNHSNILL